MILRRIPAADVRPATQDDALDPATLAAAAAIVDDVRDHGEPAIRRHAARFGELPANPNDHTNPAAPLALSPAHLAAALGRIDPADRAVLERTHARIKDFALAQRRAIADLDHPVPGGRAGHTLLPVERAGCYIPGGRYPLPSTALMTIATARAAGCPLVIAASPRPTDHTLAAASIAGADALLPIGGPHAIAALAFGTPHTPPADLICGPGNRYVTAAKHLVSRSVGIDMLAGPSELLVLADHTADPALIAADLLAQAEHDDLARPILVTTSPTLADAVDAQLDAQLDATFRDLPSEHTARAALRNGFIALAADLDEALAATDRLAPEHLEIHTADPLAVAARVRHAGGLFIGPAAAEVFGDFGLGPNHTLPTGGSARSTAGLSVYTFLRARTWLRLDAAPDPQALSDALRLAELEGLPAHRASAARRLR